MIYSLLLFCWFGNAASAAPDEGSTAMVFDTKECNRTKLCMMKPIGCHPDRDCTQGYMLSVIGPNQLKAEMFAQSLVPSVPLQYLSLGFSKDQFMGDDMVAECVVSEEGIEGAEVFLSFNVDKTNDRTQLDERETRAIFTNVQSSIVDGRIACSYILSIRPNIKYDHENRINDLDTPVYIFGATGASQPDELLNHDLNRESLYFPLVSHEKVIPAKIGNNQFVHPESHLNKDNSNNEKKKTTAAPAATPRPAVKGSCSGILSLSTFIILLMHLLF